MSPFAPLIIDDQKDALILLSRKSLLTRPRLMSQINNVRAKKYQEKKKRNIQ